MKIFIINLEHSTDRKAFMIEQLNKFNLPYEFISGVYGKKLTDQELSEHCELDSVKNDKWLSKGAIICALSHIKIYKKIIEENMDYAIILEDDAVLDENFENVINFIESQGFLNDETITFLFTQCRHEKMKYSNESITSIFDKKLAYPTDVSHLETALGYIVSNKISRNILKANYPIRTVCDRWHELYEKNVFKQANVILPFLVKPNGFDSEIGYDQKSVNVKIKSFIKKLYKFFFPKQYNLKVKKTTDLFIQNNTDYCFVDEKPFFKA